MVPGYPKGLTTLGDHIKKARLDRGLLQKDVATVIGVTPFTILNWERLKVLNGDKRAIFSAAAHAQRAADFLNSLQPQAQTEAAA